MIEMNFWAILVAALSAFLVGAIWYNPKVMGTFWMRAAGLTEDDLKGANMFKLFGLALLFAFMIAFSLQFFVVHQWGAFGMIGGDVEHAKPSYAEFMHDYGHAFRTAKHGAIHGFFSGLLYALPLLGTIALFERKSWKYILVNAGYWIICLTLMGAIIAAWQ